MTRRDEHRTVSLRCPRLISSARSARCALRPSAFACALGCLRPGHAGQAFNPATTSCSSNSSRPPSRVRGVRASAVRGSPCSLGSPGDPGCTAAADAHAHDRAERRPESAVRPRGPRAEIQQGDEVEPSPSRNAPESEAMTNVTLSERLPLGTPDRQGLGSDTRARKRRPKAGARSERSDRNRTGRRCGAPTPRAHSVIPCSLSL
jgi:hypothetical protein